MSDLTLKPDDHELWLCVCKRLKEGFSWEDIALEIGSNSDDLLHWANHVYQPRKEPMVRTPVTATYRKRAIMDEHDLPSDSPHRMSPQYQAWKRAREGARKTLEAS